MPYIHRTECERLQIVFNNLLKTIAASCESGYEKGSTEPKKSKQVVVSTKSMSLKYLVKLHKKCITLASKCNPDMGCKSTCQYCSEKYINTVFNKLALQITPKEDI